MLVVSARSLRLAALTWMVNMDEFTLVTKNGKEEGADHLMGSPQASILLEYPDIHYIKDSKTGKRVWTRR